MVRKVQGGRESGGILGIEGVDVALHDRAGGCDGVGVRYGLRIVAHRMAPQVVGRGEEVNMRLKGHLRNCAAGLRGTAVAAIAAVVLLGSGVVWPPAAQGAEGHDLVRIGAFSIDRHEVTIGQFRKFVQATGRRTKAETDGGGAQFIGGWQRMPGWVWSAPYGTAGDEREPAVHVTWGEARDYCRFAGLRLPTDKEWVEAAYTERRRAPPAPFAPDVTYPFPTGASPDGANQIQGLSKLSGFTAPAARIGQGRGHVAVATTAAGVNGLHDMGGNVWEWVDEDVGGNKRTRGGSWWYGPAQMRVDALYDKPADFGAVYIGFRCARDG
jgi:formylglycine-generating enzyme required for sulfatase activity